MGGTCGLKKTSSCRPLEVLTQIPHLINDRSQRICLPPYLWPVKEGKTQVVNNFVEEKKKAETAGRERD